MMSMLEQCQPEMLGALLGAMQVEQCTHVRTYSQRTTHLKNESHVGDARRGAAKFDQLGEENSPEANAARGLTGIFGPRTGDRFPVIRTRHTEDRAPIRRDDRITVYARDHFRCVWCGSNEQLELDHIVPWSAGGSDDIDNLRTLCRSCNRYRSNFAHPADMLWRPIPHGFACLNCCAPNEFPDPLSRVFCVWCKAHALGWPANG